VHFNFFGLNSRKNHLFVLGVRVRHEHQGLNTPDGGKPGYVIAEPVIDVNVFGCKPAGKPGRESGGVDSRESGRPEDSRRRTGVDSTKRRPGTSTRSLYILNVACTIPPIPRT